MEADKVDKFLLANESKFPDYEIPIHRLLDLPPEKEAILAKNHFKSPICMLSVSCFLGYFGLELFQDMDFWLSVGRTLVICVVSVSISIALLLGVMFVVYRTIVNIIPS